MAVVGNYVDEFQPTFVGEELESGLFLASALCTSRRERKEDILSFDSVSPKSLLGSIRHTRMIHGLRAD